MLFHYDGQVDAWMDMEWSPQAIHVMAANQTKWWAHFFAFRNQESNDCRLNGALFDSEILVSRNRSRHKWIFLFRLDRLCSNREALREGSFLFGIMLFINIQSCLIQLWHVLHGQGVIFFSAEFWATWYLYVFRLWLNTRRSHLF